jgi:hypothetical protein
MRRWRVGNWLPDRYRGPQGPSVTHDRLLLEVEGRPNPTVEMRYVGRACEVRQTGGKRRGPLALQRAVTCVNIARPFPTFTNALLPCSMIKAACSKETSDQGMRAPSSACCDAAMRWRLTVEEQVGGR